MTRCMFGYTALKKAETAQQMLSAVATLNFTSSKLWEIMVDEKQRSVMNIVYAIAIRNYFREHSKVNPV